MDQSAAHLKVFQKYLPAPAVAYGYQLWQRYAFDFRITKTRRSKFGDYRFLDNRHKITVNGDLNPYAFLVTYIHEVAHLVAFQNRTRNASPHGREWKAAFRALAQPVLNEAVFPAEILAALRGYLQNPKASSCSDIALFKVLHPPDAQADKSALADLPEGEIFSLNGRQFRKGATRRTRGWCEEIKSRKKYLVHLQALVEK